MCKYALSQAHGCLAVLKSTAALPLGAKDSLDHPLPPPLPLSLFLISQICHSDGQKAMGSLGPCRHHHIELPDVFWSNFLSFLATHYNSVRGLYSAPCHSLQ